MRRLFVLGSLVGTASLSAAALTVTFDAPPTIVRDKVATTQIALTGTLDLLTGVTAKPDGVSILVLTATGPGKSFGLGDVAVNGAILNGMPQGRFVGTLFTLPIAPTTPLGTYTGTFQIRLKFGRTTTQTSAITPFSFVVKAPAPPVPPPAVPEPGSLAVLGMSALLLRRRVPLLL